MHPSRLKNVFAHSSDGMLRMKQSGAQSFATETRKIAVLLVFSMLSLWLVFVVTVISCVHSF